MRPADYPLLDLTVRQLRRCLVVPYLTPVLVIVLCFGTADVSGQNNKSLSALELKQLPIEELIDLEVALVSRSPQKLSQATSSVQVITGRDIRRSGATNVVEALRLVTNLQVSQQRSNSWIVSARGFNTLFANKLLVLIDGRTVYTPLYGGVLWDQQNVLLEDIEKIEVVSGPGGTLWGANAVNGIINIVTKATSETHGLYATAQAGNVIRNRASLRYGGRVGKNLNYRVYGQHFSRAPTELPDGSDFNDAWYLTQGGFRVDWSAGKADTYTVQGDLYGGAIKSPGTSSDMDGHNILARWQHKISEASDLSLQVYYDKYFKSDGPANSSDQMRTVDADFQYKFPLGKVHSITAGAGYRRVRDHFISGTAVAILPSRRNLDLVDAFVRDEITLAKKWTMAIGAKVLHNVYTGVEFQPSGRLSYAFTTGNVWAAITRSVRTPSRVDVEYFSPAPPQPPTQLGITGGPGFVSEKLVAYEMGYRVVSLAKATLSVAAFHNEYKDLYSLEPVAGTLRYEIRNGTSAKSRGAELSAAYQLLDNWRVRGGYTFFDMDLKSQNKNAIDPSYQANDVQNQVMLHSMTELPFGFSFDVMGRYLDHIPASLATVKVPAYATLDVRIAYNYRFAELSLVGQNLAKKKHMEFGNLAIPRSLFAKLTVRL